MYCTSVMHLSRVYAMHLRVRQVVDALPSDQATERGATPAALFDQWNLPRFIVMKRAHVEIWQLRNLLH